MILIGYILLYNLSEHFAVKKQYAAFPPILLGAIVFHKK